MRLSRNNYDDLEITFEQTENGDISDAELNAIFLRAKAIIESGGSGRRGKTTQFNQIRNIREELHPVGDTHCVSICTTTAAAPSDVNVEVQTDPQAMGVYATIVPAKIASPSTSGGAYRCTRGVKHMIRTAVLVARWASVSLTRCSQALAWRILAHPSAKNGIC